MTQPIAPSAFSTFVRNLPDLLQEPASLALLGSIGAHLFFFATLPAFTSLPKQPSLRSVRLVNLTPQQQSRLPQSPLTSQFGLPPLPNSGSKLTLPLGQPFPQSPLPDASQLYKIPDLSIPIPRAQPQPPFDISRYVFRPKTTPFIPAKPAIPQPPSDPTSSNNPPSQPFPPNAPSSGATDPNIPRLPSAPIVPNPNNQAAANPPGNNPANTTPAAPSPNDRLVAENQQKELYARENFVFDPTVGATDSERGQQATQKYAEWFEENITNKNIADDQLEEKAIGREVAYRSPAPLTERYSPVLVYVLLDPQGKVAASPAVVGRSGYRYLDILAQRDVNQQISKLTPTGKYVIYKITLTFKPESQTPAMPTN